jgi:hypothetical protein
MSRQRGIAWARGIGFVLGAGIAVSAIAGWTLPRGTGRPGADVAVVFLQTGELQLSSLTPVIDESSLYPGTPAEGSVDVRNSSGSRLDVGLSAEPSVEALDRLLWIDISAAGRRIFRGPLGALRDGSQRFTISPLATRTLDVRAWLPASVAGGYEGSIDDVNLTFDPRVVAP